MLDERTKHPVYQENMQAANTRVGLNIFVRILFPTSCVILSCASALWKGSSSLLHKAALPGNKKSQLLRTFPLHRKDENQLKEIKSNLIRCLVPGIMGHPYLRNHPLPPNVIYTIT